MHILIYFLIMLIICVQGCSDFYAKDFIHIASATQGTKEENTQKEREIQAMRKSQILQDEHTRVLMIVRYVNEIDSTLLQNGKEEVFLVEVYAKDETLSPNLFSFTLSNTYKSTQANAIIKLSKEELAQFAPDIIYNDVYKVSFAHMGARGRDSLKLLAHIKGIGDMSFDFGYAKAKSNLTK
ncbi:hypothetical protein [Helicobacter marmotae]|nr:hypothetical protein [Helicobacter marmotae]